MHATKRGEPSSNQSGNEQAESQARTGSLGMDGHRVCLRDGFSSSVSECWRS